MTRRVGTVLVVLALALAARADDWTKQFTVSSHPEFQLNTNDGRVFLNAWDKNQIEVKIHTVGVRIPDKLQVAADQAGNKVRVDMHSGNNVCFGFCVISIEVVVNLPKDSVVNVRTSDGRIEANDLTGDLHLRSDDGRITGRNLGGNLNAETSDGHIEVDGRFDLLHVRSGDGHVTVRANYASKMSGDWSVSTNDGKVEVELPQDLAANLDVHTADGHIESDLAVEVQGASQENALRGKLNGGGPRLEVHTGDGSIRLRRTQGSL